MTCDYPDCPEPAAFTCTSEGEETRKLCDAHKQSAEAICAFWGWTLTVIPLTVS